MITTNEDSKWKTREGSVSRELYGFEYLGWGRGVKKSEKD